MKNLLVCFVIMFLTGAVMAANVTVLNTDSRTKNGNPKDIFPVELFDADEDAVDTFATGVVKVLGPYGLTSDGSVPMFSGFAIAVRSITGTTPGFSVDYCTTPSSDYADTASGCANWVSIDSVATSGNGFNTYVALTSRADRFIWFRFNNYDNAAAQIPKKVTVSFKKAGTFEVK